MFSYGRLLRTNSIVIAKPMAIATIMPATAGAKYMSAADCGGVSVGAVVGDAGSTLKAVIAFDG